MLSVTAGSDSCSSTYVTPRKHHTCSNYHTNQANSVIALHKQLQTSQAVLVSAETRSNAARE